jgi:DNA-binding NarL/FixJ family response regulator
MGETIRVLMADDHPTMRVGLRAILEPEPDLTLVGEAADGDETRRLCEELAPDVLLLDLSMPGPPAAETVAYLREHCSQTKIVVLTAYSNDHYVRGVAGNIEGYVLKDEAPETVVQAIHAVMQGGVWFSKPIVEKLAQLAAGEASPDEQPTLTQRELEVLRLLAQGYRNQRIAEELCISERTVRSHLRNIYDKIGVQSRTEAALWAARQGLNGESLPSDHRP